jgi:rfaE bifunctional protein nucleotidyltransferase chain/domain
MHHSLTGHPLVQRPLVMATGVFDLLHVQHVKLLQEARTFGACLVVGINSDESVRRLKGPHRPIIPEGDRLRMVTSLRCVNAAVLFHQDTPAELVRYWKPDILVKGHDYRDSVLPEAETLKDWGGRVWIADTSSRESTTAIINRIRSLP